MVELNQDDQLLAVLVQEGIIHSTKVEGLGNGFHTSPLFTEGTVIKQQTFDTKPEAEQFAELITVYRDKIAECSIRTPQRYQTYVMQSPSSSNRFLAIEISSYEGVTLASQLHKIGSAVAAELLFKTLFGFFNSQTDEKLTVGLDPSCSNFTTQDRDTDPEEITFVDFIPPRFCVDGTPMVDYPKPTPETDLESQVRRFYTKAGISLIALTQLLRHEPDSFQEVWGQFVRIAKTMSQFSVIEEIQSLMGRMTTASNFTAVFNRSMTEEMRLYGVLLFSQHRLTKDDLRAFYRLTHISEITRLIPEEDYLKALSMIS